MRASSFLFRVSPVRSILLSSRPQLVNRPPPLPARGPTVCVPSILWRTPARFCPPSLALPLTGGRTRHFCVGEAKGHCRQRAWQPTPAGGHPAQEGKPRPPSPPGRGPAKQGGGLSPPARARKAPLPSPEGMKTSPLPSHFPNCRAVNLTGGGNLPGWGPAGPLGHAIRITRWQRGKPGLSVAERRRRKPCRRARSAGGLLRRERPPRKEHGTVRHHPRFVQSRPERFTISCSRTNALSA